MRMSLSFPLQVNSLIMKIPLNGIHLGDVIQPNHNTVCCVKMFFETKLEGKT